MWARFCLAQPSGYPRAFGESAISLAGTFGRPNPWVFPAQFAQKKFRKPPGLGSPIYFTCQYINANLALWWRTDAKSTHNVHYYLLDSCICNAQDTFISDRQICISKFGISFSYYKLFHRSTSIPNAGYWCCKSYLCYMHINHSYLNFCIGFHSILMWIELLQ